MRFGIPFAIAFASTLGACDSPRLDGRDECTLRAIGKELGAGRLRATLRVPDEYLSGAEISNGGVIVLWGDCDYSLNAFLSHETASHIIEAAPPATLTNHGDRLVEADLGVWKFEDGSGEPRFFVSDVLAMAPITAPRTDEEERYFTMPPNGS